MTAAPPFNGRELGVLLHPSCLPGREDIGTLGAEAYDFVDWLAASGSSIWQILPLTPNGQHDSPYFSYTAFGGNPWLIDLVNLQSAGLIKHPRLYDEEIDDSVPFDMLPATKEPQLLAAAKAFLETPDHEWAAGFEVFRSRQAHWLDDTCLYLALRREQGRPWWEWPPPLRTRDGDALAASTEELAHRIALWRVVFYFVERQWGELKAYAHGKGIKVLGDLPIYVTHDSADVWLHQDEFSLDEEGHLIVQSGVPPDYFSQTGQLWGNPIYRWDVMARNDYEWWMSRLRRCAELTDIVRIDHFRALSAYWEIPGGAPNAINGQWQRGPGQRFFDVLAAAIPSMPFIAEDLGTLDDDVYRLRDDNHLYGMRILQFAYDGNPDNPHLPRNYVTRCISYPGTHDNMPMAEWWAGLDPHTRERVAADWHMSPDASPADAAWRSVETAIESIADVAIVPIQDVLGLDGTHRMNDPGSFDGNWSWRMPSGSLTDDRAAALHSLATRAGRLATGDPR